MPGIIWKVYVPMLVCPPTLKFVFLFFSPNAQAEANLGSGALLQFDSLLSHEGIPLCKP